MPIDPFAALNAILRAEAARADLARRRAAGSGSSTGSGSSGSPASPGSSAGSGGSGGTARSARPADAERDAASVAAAERGATERRKKTGTRQ